MLIGDFPPNMNENRLSVFVPAFLNFVGRNLGWVHGWKTHPLRIQISAVSHRGGPKKRRFGPWGAERLEMPLSQKSSPQLCCLFGLFFFGPLQVPNTNHTSTRGLNY
jgi:hypothetical protein